MRWKKIEGWDYSVSDTGEIRNNLTAKILKPAIGSHGYRKVSLHGGSGICKQFLVHRVVASAFVVGDGKAVNHKDGDKLNNNAENLEWCTYKQNTVHAFNAGLIPRGDGHHLTRVMDVELTEIRRLYSTGKASQVELSKRFGVSQSQISRYVTNKRRGGFGG